MSQVNKTPLSSIVSSTTGGGTPERSNPALWNGGIPWASVKDFQDKNRKLTCTQEEISREGLNRSASHLIPAGTPIICTRMAVGRIAIAAVPTAINQDLRALHLRDGFDVDYVVLAIEGIREKIESLSIESTVKGISIEQLLRFEIPDFPLEEQTKIAEILSMVDRAIEQTEAFIAKQQRIKTGLMQDLLTRGIDEQGNLRSEETHEFKDSPLGRIPAEWGSSNIGEVLAAKPKNGYSPTESDSWQGGYMLGLGCLTSEGFTPDQLKYAPPSDQRITSAILSPGDFLITRSNTRSRVGMVGIYRDVGEPCIYPDLMMRLCFTDAVVPEYMQLVLMSPPLRRQIENAATGTSGSMVKISATIVQDLAFRKPPYQEQQRLLSALQEQGAAKEALGLTLLKLRSEKAALMQDILTGKKRVTPLLETQYPTAQTP